MASGERSNTMNSVEQRIATSVLVVGAGGAGLRAAIELAERRMDVLVVAKRARSDAHTSLAASGINAALATMDPRLQSLTQLAAPTLGAEDRPARSRFALAPNAGRQRYLLPGHVDPGGSPNLRATRP
jgi:glycine/D-amino acid oxidase-like deaminating enzyme